MLSSLSRTHNPEATVEPSPVPIDFTRQDIEFLGVNMRVKPHLLPPGLASGARNKEFTKRSADTRLGIHKLVWTNRATRLQFSVDTGSKIATTTTLHRLVTGDPVGLANFGGGLPIGLTTTDYYYVRVLTANTVTLHPTATDATNNTNIVNITTTGTGTHYMAVLRAQPFGAIYGAGVFKDPDDTEWIIIGADEALYRCRDGQMAAELLWPERISGTMPFFLVQALDEVLLFRGESLVPWTMANVDTGFVAIAQRANEVTGVSSENPIDGTEAIPNAVNALFLGNRLFVPYDRDLIAASDFLNFTRYHPVRANFRVQQGTEDKLVVLFKFNETTVIVGKERSIAVVENVYGDLSTARLDELTREYGVRAARSFAQVGSDVWFLADRRGVSSIRQTEENKLQAIDLPVSEPLQPLIDRINWQYAADAVAAYHENKYYLAVPLDSAEVVRSNLVAAGTNYGTDGGSSLNVFKGRKYRYTLGATELVAATAGTLINGTETLSADGDFTAQSSTVQLRVARNLLFDNFEGEHDGQYEENYEDWRNWDVMLGKIDLIGSDPINGPDATYWGDPAPSPFDALNPEGLYVDLIGTSTNGPTIFQSAEQFTLTAGKTYKLDCKLAGNLRGGGTQKVGVMLGWSTSNTFTVNTGTKILTTSGAHGLSTGDKVALAQSAAWPDAELPGGLSMTVGYFARVLSPTTLTLHPTATDATNNTNIVNITTTGTGTHSISKVTYHEERSIGETDATTSFSSGNITVSGSTPVKIRFHHELSSKQNVGTFLMEVKLYEVGAAPAVTASVQPVFTGVNNAILVYNFLTKNWAGYYDGQAVLVKDFFKHTYNGVTRLFFASNDGFINLMEEGFEDHISDQHGQVSVAGISDELLTRGYTAGDLRPKRWRGYEVQQRTWAPKFTHVAQFDGVNETLTLKSDVTRSRTKYYKPFDAADYNVNNSGNDHGTAFREDYSVNLATSAVTLAVGASGINPDLHQEKLEDGRIGKMGRYCQLKLTNTQGRCEIATVELTAQANQKWKGAQA